MSEEREIHEQDQMLAGAVERQKGRNLLRALEVRERQLEVEGQTDSAHLDSLLEASAEFYQWHIHRRVAPDYEPPEKTAASSERYASELLKVQKALHGNYQDKANYCLEKANSHQSIADISEKDLPETPEGEERDELNETIQYARRVAANYLRAAANCLHPEPLSRESGQSNQASGEESNTEIQDTHPSHTSRSESDPNAREALLQMDEYKIYKGIENGSIINPDAVIILVKKEFEAAKRMLNNRANVGVESPDQVARNIAIIEAEKKPLLEGNALALTQYCAKRGRDLMTWEAPLVDDFGKPSSSNIRLMNESHAAAPYWYEMAARFARRAAESETQPPTAEQENI